MSGVRKICQGMAIIAITTTVLTGCSQVIKTGANVALGFTENHIVPPILAMDDAEINLDTPVPVRTYSCLDELTFTPEQAGEYEFVLDLRGQRPVAIVKLAQ